jgi:hypothetical protein
MVLTILTVMTGSVCSSPGPHDAARRNTGKSFGAIKFHGERGSIRSGRAARNTPVKLLAEMPHGIVPRPVIGHRPFDAKESLIVVGDDEEERWMLLGRSSCVHTNRRRRATEPGRCQQPS